jgi:hypothetical protein
MYLEGYIAPRLLWDFEFLGYTYAVEHSESYQEEMYTASLSLNMRAYGTHLVAIGEGKQFDRHDNCVLT